MCSSPVTCRNALRALRQVDGGSFPASHIRSITETAEPCSRGRTECRRCESRSHVARLLGPQIAVGWSGRCCVCFGWGPASITVDRRGGPERAGPTLGSRTRTFGVLRPHLRGGTGRRDDMDQRTLWRGKDVWWKRSAPRLAWEAFPLFSKCSAAFRSPCSGGMLSDKSSVLPHVAGCSGRRWMAGRDRLPK